MSKLILLILMIIKFPFRCFSKISPLALVRNSKLSKKCAILSNTRVYKSNISDYTYLGRNCYVHDTEIGKYCSIADYCSIGLVSHPFDWVSTSPVFLLGKNKLKTNFANKAFIDSKRTIIENDVWIGMNVSIVAGVKIGNGAVIGAGAIVTKDVAPYSIIGGNPAKLIKYRFNEEVIDSLLKLKWWDESPETLSKAGKYIDDVDLFKEELKK